MNGLNNNLTNYKAICRDCRIHVGECLENIVWVFFAVRRELVLVMNAIGNDISNAVYEANTDGHTKPSPSAAR